MVNTSYVWTLNIDAAPAITLSPSSLPDGAVGATYSATLAGADGVAPYNYTVTSGSLPAGLTLDSATGVLAGTPTHTETASFTITVTDNASTTQSQAYTVTIAAPTLAVSPAAGALAAATVGSAYSASISASGGTAPYSYAVTSGALPAGLNLDTTSGTITGTPSAAGTASFTLTATDANGATGSAAYSIAVTVAPPVAGAVSAMVAANSSTNPITLNLSGGAAASVAVASQPAHGTASASGTSITYTPSAGYSGADSFTYTATNASGTSAAATVSLTVSAPTLAISPASGALAAATVGSAYSAGISASGGTAPYSYAVTSGALPAGLNLDTTSGTITGTPSAAGTASFTLTATDANGATGSAAYSIAVTVSEMLLSPAAGALASGTVGSPYSLTLVASRGSAPYSYAVIDGALPDGLSLDASSGVLSGTPRRALTSTFTVAATDIYAVAVSAAYTLEIVAVPVVASSSTVSVAAGGSTVVDLTSGASGGPFTGAHLISLSPPSAGNAVITLGDVASTDDAVILAAVESGRYRLKFTPSASFSGVAVATYTMTGLGGTSPPAQITFIVASRPDPSEDAEVSGLLNAQSQAAQRFAAGQTRNFQERLEQLHNGSCHKSSWGIGVTDARGGASAVGNDPTVLGQPPAAAGPWPGRDDDVTSTAGGRAAPATGPAGCAADAPLAGSIAAWSAGAVTFGSTDVGASSFDFVTASISAGLDYRMDETFAVGLGLGFNNDESYIGANGTRSSGQAFSVTAYASYHPTLDTFLDGLLGVSLLSFDSRRYVTADPGLGYATGSRDGYQLFGSVAAGYLYRDPELALLFSPYARLNGAFSSLDDFSESGGGIYALNYGTQEVSSLTSVLGFRLSRDYMLGGTIVSPRFKLEYGHNFQGGTTVSLGYLEDPTAYSLDLAEVGTDFVTLGAGLDVRLDTRWQLSIGYQAMLGDSTTQQTIGASLGTQF